MSEIKENKITILIIVLLIIVMCLELFHLIKLHEISVHSQLTNLAIYGNDISRGLKHESEKLRREIDNIKKDFKRKTTPANLKKTTVPMVKSKNYDEKQQVYILELVVPNGLKKEDVEFDLKNNILGITYAGYIQVNFENVQSSDFVSVYRAFEIPETKATVNDIKYNINNDILTVMIPIIK